MNDLFEVNKIVEIKTGNANDYNQLIIASNEQEVGIIFPSEYNEDSVSIRLINIESGKELTQTIHYTTNFHFFVPTFRIRGLDFDENYIVIRFTDLNNYLCVFDRKTSQVISIIPAFDDFDQFKLIGDHLYFGKHYHTNPKQSPYSVFMYALLAIASRHIHILIKIVDIDIEDDDDFMRVYICFLFIFILMCTFFKQNHLLFGEMQKWNH